MQHFQICFAISLTVLPATASGQPPPQTGQIVTRVLQSQLFRHQYTLFDRDYCAAQVCVDFDDDGQRELIFASRATGRIQMLRAADGQVEWGRELRGKQQSAAAFDVNADGEFEIIYTVSNPGLLYLLAPNGKTLHEYDAGDWKLGNSPVVLDADGDGRLEACFGTRGHYLVRLDLTDFSNVVRRESWGQCGCYTSAMDVDGDGRWDLFAGSGDDSPAKGVLHRYDPLTLKSAWQFATNDNASSADAVLVDFDRDGDVEIIKSVDNYAGDDAHDAVYAFETDGTLLWKVPGLSGEDSPNAADLDGDGSVEIVGMTFGGEVYCLDAKGEFKWRRDLRPQLGDEQHMYMAPILCDLDGQSGLEILAMTNGAYAPNPDKQPPAILFALNANGEVLDRLDLGVPRYWGHAFVCNIDDDPYLELVVSGLGGLDVFETRGFGPDIEHFQRRRNYQRLNVLPWAYEDNYFIERGQREQLEHRADNLVLAHDSGRYVLTGRFVTALLTLPPGGRFEALSFDTDVPPGTEVAVNVLDASGRLTAENVASGDRLGIEQPVRLEFVLSTAAGDATPQLRSWSLAFSRQ